MPPTVINPRAHSPIASSSAARSCWQLNRVEIVVAIENRRSRAIPERLGFREEGTLRQLLDAG